MSSCGTSSTVALAWSYDVVSLYLMPALFFLTLSRAHDVGAHIGVDIVQSRMPSQVRHLCQVIVGLLSAAFFLALAVFGGMRTFDEFTAGSTVVGEFAWENLAVDRFLSR